MKISVIITLYQAQATLIRCIESVEKAIKKLDSRYKYDGEIILVNDGSTDDSHKVCKALAKKHNNIVYIFENHLGKAHARNEALFVASGEYICFVDPEDEIDERYLTTLLSEMKSDTALVISRPENIFDTQKRNKVVKKERIEIISSGQNAMEKIALEFENVTALGMLFRRNYIKHYLQEDKEPLSEVCFVIDYLSEAAGIVKIVNDERYYKHNYPENEITIESLIGLKRAYFYISDIMLASGCKGKENLLLKYLDCYAKHFQKMSQEERNSPIARELWYKFREEGISIKKNMRMSLLESIYFSTMLNSVKLVGEHK